MAHDSKRGFFLSLFGKRRPTEQNEAAELDSKHKLEERIRQVLAEKVEIPELLMREETKAVLMTEGKKVEAPVELFPISASVIPIRKPPVEAAFSISDYERPRSHAANER
jgi:hypothetical protein